MLYPAISDPSVYGERLNLSVIEIRQMKSMFWGVYRSYESCASSTCRLRHPECLPTKVGVRKRRDVLSSERNIQLSVREDRDPEIDPNVSDRLTLGLVYGYWKCETYRELTTQRPGAPASALQHLFSIIWVRSSSAFETTVRTSSNISPPLGRPVGLGGCTLGLGRSWTSPDAGTGGHKV